MTGKPMKKTKYFLLTLILIPLYSCAPGAHVRVGIGVHTPGPWGGNYPYPGGTVVIGRPVETRSYPLLNDESVKKMSNADQIQSPAVQN